MRRLSACLALAAVALAPALTAQSKEIRDSIAALEARARTDSIDPGTLYRLSVYYYLAKRYDDEQRVLHRVIALDPRNAVALLAVADSPFELRPRLRDEARRGRVPANWRSAVDRARLLGRQAFLIDPLADFRFRGHEANEGEAAPPPPKNDEEGDEESAPSAQPGAAADQALPLCIRSLAEASYQAAYDTCRRYAHLRFGAAPRDSVPSFVWWYRGTAAAHLGLIPVALEDFQALLDRSATRDIVDSLVPFQLRSADYRYAFAVINEAAHRPADALRLYQQAAAADSSLFMAHVRLAAMYRQFKMWPQAIEEQQRAIAANPGDPTALYELGIIFTEAGKPALAEEPLRQAMGQNPLDPRIPYQLGLVEQALTKPADARAAFERVLALGSRFYERYTTDAKQRLAALP